MSLPDVVHEISMPPGVSEYTKKHILSRNKCNLTDNIFMASKNVDFTKRLKDTIKQMRLNPPAFAEKAKMGYSTLMNYLKKGAEGHVPEWDQLVKISTASDKSIDWLLTGKETGPSRKTTS
jgi:hypothetical protein